jgi:hypothetical protein
LESINIKIETLSSALKNQLSFNKMIELRLIPGKFRGNPKLPLRMLAWWPPGGETHPVGHHAGRSMRQRANAWGALTAAIQGDLGVPMISYSIYDCHYNQALYDLGASINIMPKVIFEQLQYPTLSPTLMYVQLADSTIQYPKEIIGASQELLHPRHLRGPQQGGRLRRTAYPWATIPKGRQSKDRCWDRINPCPHRGLK